MSWLLWRQHRTQALVTGAILALFAVAVLLTGVRMAHDYHDAVRNCTANGTCGLLGNLFNGDGAIIDLVHLSIAVPLLLGVLGATLVARETEHATNVLVWTQTVTRRRWLLTKVAMALGATLLTSAAVTALVTWWSRTPNSLDRNRFEGAQFDTQNVVPIAFALFAVALGLAAGSVLRRTLPALATTVGVYAAIRVLVAVYLRPHYMNAVTRLVPIGADPSLPSGSWTVSGHLVDASGRVVPDGRINVPQSCASSVDRSGVQRCLGRLGYRDVVKFHPAGQYWHFQWAEAALFLGLAAALTTIAIVHTLRSDA